MTTSDNKTFFLDTNILVYAADTTSPFHGACKKLREQGMTGNISLCISPQVLFEFFAVITNSKRVTQPIKPQEAIKEMTKYLRAAHIIKIYPKSTVIEKTIELCQKHNTKSQEIFDVQIVATMLSNGITNIYTYDTSHFSRFEEIEVLTP